MRARPRKTTGIGQSTPPMMSIGTADVDTVRGCPRLPSTETVSSVVASSLDGAVAGAAAGSAVCAKAVPLPARVAATRAHLTADASGVLETRAYGFSLLPMRCAPK